MPHILLIEDSEEYTEVICPTLEKAGYTVTAVPCTEMAIAALLACPTDLIISDVHLPFTLDRRHFDFQYSVEVGTRTIEELRLALPQMPIIAITAAMESDKTTTARLNGLVPVLHKPFSPHSLLEMIDFMLEPKQAALALIQ